MRHGFTSLKVSNSGTFEVHVDTDTGRIRSRNEDSVDAWLATGAGRALAVVADGVGGHPGGDVASRTALDSIMTEARSGPPARRQADWLERVLLAANRNIRLSQGTNAELARMATTVVAMLAAGSSVTIAHLGDSRAYRLRNARLIQLTTDHTVAQAMLAEGTYRPEDLVRSPYHHVLTAGLGLEDRPRPAIARHRSKPGDLYLLCSDGLSNAASADTIRRILDTEQPLAHMAEALIAAANTAGGPDNITVALLRRLT